MNSSIKVRFFLAKKEGRRLKGEGKERGNWEGVKEKEKEKEISFGSPRG